MSKKEERIKEGLCPDCGTFSYPYYYCNTHRIIRNCNRVLKDFEDKGWVDVYTGKDGDKVFKLKENVDMDTKKYNPETVRKMQLPRLNGRPMDEDLLSECVTKVLEEHGYPLTEKEIEKGIRQLKTIGQVIPKTEELIREYKRIQNKDSDLSKTKRDAVEYKVNFLLERKVIDQSQLIS